MVAEQRSEDDPFARSHDSYEGTLYDASAIYQELDVLFKPSETSCDESSGDYSRLLDSKLNNEPDATGWGDDLSELPESKLNENADDIDWGADWGVQQIRPETLQFNVEVSGKASHSCAGLRNLGNTCFLNSVLQCLFYTVPFANYVKSGRHKSSCQVKGFCTMCALEDLMQAVHSSPGTTVSPYYLANNLFETSNLLVKGQQQDAHEFFFLLIEGLQNCCTPWEPEKYPLTAVDSSFVSDIFIGQLRSQVKCNSCLHSSYSSEASLGLSLEVENCNSIIEALSRFTAVEALDEDNKTLCEHCKDHVSRSKQLTFDKPPQVLAIHLKRFRASALSPTKIERSIDYGLSLDLMPFISEKDVNEPVQEGDLKYTLYAVLVHSGWSTASGHYFCFVQTSPGTWHHMSDNLVSEVSEKTVLEQEAYILFYIRGGMEVFSGISTSAISSCSEPPPIYSNESCIKPTVHETTMTNNECDTDLTFVTPAAPNISKQAEAADICTCSQVKVPASQTKSNSPLNQIGSNDVPYISSLSMNKTSNKLHSSTNGSFIVKQSGGHNDEQMCVKPEQSKKVQKSYQSASETKRNQSLVHLKGGAQAVTDSFQNGTQQSYMRLLSAMPANRRQALLASTFSGQEAKKPSPLALNMVDAAEKPSVRKKTKISLQDGGSPNIMKKQHLEDILMEGKHKISADKPWIEDYRSHIGSRKLPRVAGGKRIVASLVDLDTLGGCAKNTHKSGFSQVDGSKQNRLMSTSGAAWQHDVRG